MIEWPRLSGAVTLFVMALATSVTPIAASAQSTVSWSAGLRAEYARVGDGQFTNIGSGIGINGFAQRPLSGRHVLEFGISVTHHKFYFLCVFGRPCGDGATALAEVYLRPALRTIIPGTSIAPYVGPRIGLLFGDFQDGSVGVDMGGTGGLTVPVISWLSVDVGVIASLVYVGPPPSQASRRAWDWRLTLQAGMVFDLGR